VRGAYFSSVEQACSGAVEVLERKFMKILGLRDSFWTVHYGRAWGLAQEGPFYSLSEAEAKILDLMESKKKPRGWITIKENQKVIRIWGQVEDGVWKEFPVND
jgi:hypothetical protein